MQRLVVLLVLLLLSPISLASPPPGEPEVTNDICSTWNSSDGICDDYQSILDGSTTNEWIKSSINVNVDTAETVSLTISTAIHELSRSDLDLDDLDLEGDSDLDDGIPADYIRNYLDFERNGLTVEERMISLIQTNMREYIEDNFEYTDSSLLNTISSIDFSSENNLECTYTNSLDSTDEVNGIPNDPFNPPICFRGVFELVLNPDKLGLTEDTGNINRVIEGLLLMGGDISSSFNAKALAGHYVELTVFPPSYSTTYQVNHPGVLIINNYPNQSPQGYGYLYLDNTNPDSLDNSISADLDMRIKNRNADSVLTILEEYRPSLTIDIVIDARDSSNTEIEILLSIHHLDSDTLSNWIIDFNEGGMNLPLITSDGIRMLNNELEKDLTDLLDGIPIDDLSSGFSKLFGSEIHFTPPIFSPSNMEGGLDFRHRTGETCDELLEVRYCLYDDDPSAIMSGDYPIFLQSDSQPVQVQVSEIIENMLGSSLGDLSTLDFSIINDEDLAAAMSIIEVEFSTNPYWLQDLLPEDFPNTDINLELILPEWIESTIGENSVLEVRSSFYEHTTSNKIGFEGTRNFDWNHPICLHSIPCEDNSSDLICSSSQGTCITSKAEIFINNVAINELTGSIKIDFEAELTLSIHRIRVDLGEDEIELKPIPSDLIRRAIAVGDRKPSYYVSDEYHEGGLLGDSEVKAPIDFGNGNKINLTISNSGIKDFVNDLNDIYPSILDENKISGFPLDMGFGKYELNANLESTPFVFHSEIYEIPDTLTPSDLDPINFSASIKNAEISISSVDNQINLDIHRSYIKTSLNALEWPFGDPITSDFGLTFSNSQMQQQIFPLMEHTVFGTIRSSSLIIIHMPDELRFTSFESSNGLGDISEINGRQVLTYLTPICPDSKTWDNCKENSDTVTYSLEYSWSFIFKELITYVIIISAISSLFMVRFLRKRKEKIIQKLILEELEDNKLTEAAAVAEFGAMDSPVLMVEESFFEDD
mgnify:CR=1 FL=1|jgi:hypothetical protein|tara:strand:+ start:1404 stop:4373 length:2970 start_codon:yes stop_codon:yes gene_type:complete